MLSICSSFAGGGRVELEDIHIQNVSAPDVCRPFEIQDINNAGIHNVTLSDMNIESRYGCLLFTPTKGSIEDIAIRNVKMKIKEDETKFNKSTDAAVVECGGIHDLLFENVTIEVADEVRDWWKHDIRCSNCEGVELYRCKCRQ